MPIMNAPGPISDDELPATIARHFDQNTFASFPVLLKLLEMDYRTLVDLIDFAGEKLPMRTKGSGKKRPRRAFILSDVKILLHQMTQGENACPIYPARTSGEPRRILNGVGVRARGKVSASVVQLEPRTKRKPKNSQRQS